MGEQTGLIPMERIERAILLIRGEKVMLDSDLADIYGVSTKVMNQAVKRNATRFPLDFMFQLTEAEKTEVVTNCDHLNRLKFSPFLPFAFTEHGALMLANVLGNYCPNRSNCGAGARLFNFSRSCWRREARTFPSGVSSDSSKLDNICLARCNTSLGTPASRATWMP